MAAAMSNQNIIIMPKFITLTNQMGRKYYVNPEMIICVQPADYSKQITIVNLVGYFIEVSESPEEVMALILRGRGHSLMGE